MTIKERRAIHPSLAIEQTFRIHRYTEIVMATFIISIMDIYTQVCNFARIFVLFHRGRCFWKVNPGAAKRRTLVLLVQWHARELWQFFSRVKGGDEKCCCCCACEGGCGGNKEREYNKKQGSKTVSQK